MHKLSFILWLLCSAGIITASCSVLDQTRQKPVIPVIPVPLIQPSPKETIVTLDKISEGYEVIVAILDKEKADLLSLTPGEIAKRIFCANEKMFPPENVIVVPEDDPSLGPFTNQFIHQTRGAILRAEILDKDSHAVRIFGPGSPKDVYIRVLLAKKKVERLVKDKTY